ncbi:unnamed protein product, partial [Iphiclides podalirius]
MFTIGNILTNLQKMGTELPKTHDSSGGTDSNSDSENSSSSDSSGSDWQCSGPKQSSVCKPHFSVTSCDTGLKLKIAAIPPRKVSPKKIVRPVAKKKPEEDSKSAVTKDKVGVKKSQLSDTSSSSESCSKCSSDSSSDDDLPLKAVKKTLPTKCSPQKGTLQKGRNVTVKSESDEHRLSSDDVKDVSKKDKDKSGVFKVNSNVKKNKSEDSNQASPVKRGQGRQRSKVSLVISS